MNVQNRTLFIADNLDIMRGIDSETVDLIYLDPPFNTNKQYKAPIGSPAEGAKFKDIWTDEDVKHEWHGEIAEQHQELYQIIRASEFTYNKSMRIYLTAMAIRLFEMKRILKPTGSIYLHCDPTANSYLRITMDALFGKQSFRREITWSNEDSSGFKSKANNWTRVNETLLYYIKSKNHTFNKQYLPLDEKTIRRYDKVDENGKRFKIYKNKDGSERRSYLNMDRGASMGSVWTDIPSFQKVNNTGENTGYPTQKPLALLQRIIRASSIEGDIVLDPFCGCATACVAAEQLGRQWIGIDISPDAEDITKLRLQEEVDKAHREPNNPNWFNPLKHVIVSMDLPVRTDSPGPLRQLLLQDFFPRSLSVEYSQEQLQGFLSDKHRMYGNQEGKCNRCQYPLPFRNMTIDHIHPKKAIEDRNHPYPLEIPRFIMENPDHPENLQLLCQACNSKKGDRSHQYLIKQLREAEILR